MPLSFHSAGIFDALTDGVGDGVGDGVIEGEGVTTGLSGAALLTVGVLLSPGFCDAPQEKRTARASTVKTRTRSNL